MYRDIPQLNKICTQKEIMHNIEIHDQNKIDIKTMVDNEAPEKFAFLNNRKKKEQIEQDRLCEVERENKILLEQITDIMQKGTMMRRSKTSGGSIMQSNFSGQKSMNSGIRKRELVKIVMENQAMLKRIQDKQPSYNVKKWGEERKHNELYINNISQFNYKDYKPTKTIVKFGVWQESNQNSLMYNNSSQNLGNQKNIKLDPIKPNSNQPRILHSKARKIGNDWYFVEVKIFRGIFSIILENLEQTNQKYTIEMGEIDGLIILQNQCKNRIENFLERVRFDQDKRSFYFLKGFSSPPATHRNLNSNEIIEENPQELKDDQRDNNIEEMQEKSQRASEQVSTGGEGQSKRGSQIEIPQEEGKQSATKQENNQEQRDKTEISPAQTDGQVLGEQKSIQDINQDRRESQQTEVKKGPQAKQEIRNESAMEDNQGEN